jgi:UDP-3-O-[3-hydroxymyristoyl] glucosamine N-acyltransferase
MHITLAELAGLVGGAVEGDGATLIHGLAPLDEAQPGDLTFVANRRQTPRLGTSRASAVLVDAQQPVDRPAIRVANAYIAFLTLLDHFFPAQHPAWGIDPRAVLGPEVQVGQGAHIGPYAVIEHGVRLGARVVIYPGAYIGEDCVIGDDCILYARVSLYARVQLGKRVIVHSGAVIGADGFGFYPLADGSYRKIPQVGRVIVGDAVEIGANTCIDRAMLGDTVIESGTKLDNLIQIGHNTHVGPHTVMAAQVGLSGSVRIGPRVRMGGQAGIADHVTIGEGATIGAQAGIGGDIGPGEVAMGSPAIRATAFKRIHFYSQRLGALFRQVKHLQQRLEQLEGRENGV